MHAIGAYALRCACVVAFYAVSMALLGVRLGRQEMVRSAERAIYGVFGLVSIAMLAMLYALLTHDFHLQYVANVSNRAMPTFYLVAALWGGQEGSMLLWLWILASIVPWSWRSIASESCPRSLRDRDIDAHGPAVSLCSSWPKSVSAAAAGTRVAGPQSAVATSLDGDSSAHALPGIRRHDPFAFAMGALASGQLDTHWLRCAALDIGPLAVARNRHFTGSQWVCGISWGSYWAWDPVENASLMPSRQAPPFTFGDDQKRRAY